MINKPRKELVRAQFIDLEAKYPGLSLSEFADDRGWTVSGALKYRAEYKGVELGDEYKIKLTIPPDYPETPPVAEEVGGEIPSNFHKISDTQLCLTAPEGVKLKFLKHPTILGFVDKLVIPYFYAFNYLQKFGEMPFGELQHGIKGRVEFYYDFFETGDLEVVIRLLGILTYDSYKGQSYCPCGSGKKQKKCHGPKLLELRRHFTQVHFKDTYFSFLFFSAKEELVIQDGVY